MVIYISTITDVSQIDGYKVYCSDTEVGKQGDLQVYNIIEPRHEISNNLVCATSKASDQPAHMRSLIRAFAGRLIILWVLKVL